MAKKCTKSYNARVEPLFCSFNLLYSDAPVAVAIVTTLNSLLTGCDRTLLGCFAGNLFSTVAVPQTTSPKLTVFKIKAISSHTKHDFAGYITRYLTCMTLHFSPARLSCPDTCL